MFGGVIEKGAKKIKTYLKLAPTCLLYVLEIIILVAP